MKRIIKQLLNTALCFTVLYGALATAQSTPMKNLAYPAEWKQLQDIENQGLSQKAYELADKIYQQAQKDHQGYEQIKAFFIKERYRRVVTDASQNTQETMAALQTLLSQSDGVNKSIVHSMIGQLLWQYYSANRYRFVGRTQIVSKDDPSKPIVPQNDIETWDLKTLQSETAKHYRASLANLDALQKTPISQVELLLIDSKNDKNNDNQNHRLRPTLYDLLAQRALTYFTNTESGLSSPSATFSLNNPSYYGTAEKFAKADLPSMDALGYDALSIYQNLINFHQKSTASDALVDADLARLEFINKYQTVENKQDLFIAALDQMKTRYDNIPQNSEVYAALARAYDQGYPYNPKTSPQNQGYKKKALEICQKAIEKYPRNTGTSLCQQHIIQLTTQEASIDIPSVVIPNERFPFLLKYRNIAKAYLKVVAIDDKTYATLQYGDWNSREQLVKSFLKKPATHDFNQDVKNKSDLQLNSIELPFPALPIGYYLVFFSGNDSFSNVSQNQGWSLVQASQLSFLRRDNPSQLSTDLYVLDRESGLPLPETQVYVQNIPQQYTPTLVDESTSKSNIFSPDAKGYVQLDQATIGRSQGKRVWLVRGKDQLWVGDIYHHQYYHANTGQETHFFTDRAIYRPGQTVYFKGLLLERTVKALQPNQYTIIENRDTRVGFYNVNGELVLEKTFKSDEFGTFAGEFQIPKGLLNGQMRIGNDHGNAYIQVEEYKRPKFEVTFEPQAGDFKLGETVKIKGLAKSYAGATVSGAKVKYRVTRQSRYSPTSRWLRWWQPRPPIEITHGEVKTQANGEFVIEFKANPDLQIDANTKPQFNFVIFADVTDAAGETQSSQTHLAVGYEALQLNSDLPNHLILGQYKTTHLEITTLDQVPVAAAGKVSVSLLDPPKRWLRQRLWEVPLELMDKKFFIEQLPNDPYGDETDFSTWQISKQGQTRLFDTKTSEHIDISDLLSKAGVYAVKWQTQDKFGQPIELTQYTVVVDANSKPLPYPALDWFVPIKTTVEPDETASFLVGSASQVSVLYEVEQNGVILHQQRFMLNNEQKNIKLPIQASYRGNVEVHVSFIRANRVFTHKHTIVVPHSDKKLNIALKTFRNRLEPGQKEHWQLVITDYHKKPVLADMVATLYDASLDAFLPHAWNLELAQPNITYLNWQGAPLSVNKAQYVITESVANKTYKTYPDLNLFGLSMGYYQMRHKMMLSRGGPEMMAATDAMPVMEVAAAPPPPAPMAPEAVAGNAKVMATLASGRNQDASTAAKSAPKSVAPRQNFNETAFFKPTLRTNQEGEVVLDFTMPDSLTRWNFKGLAITRLLQVGQISQSVVTQKELMLTPNVPRFLRSGDTVVLMAKIDNLTDIPQDAQASLQLFDATTGNSLNGIITDKNLIHQKVKLDSKANAVARWAIQVPENIVAVSYRFEVVANQFSDAEENTLPVVTNRTLVTESLPLPMRGEGTKTFHFDKLLNNQSTTAKNYALTLEFTPNPVWYAVQALPYLMEFPYECIEQTFTRYFANRIGSHLVSKQPKIKAIFASWQNGKAHDKDALISNLLKNQEVKQVLIEETPWVMEAKDESERKKRLGLLFDAAQMEQGLDKALAKIQKEQLPSGAWGWFGGMQDDRWMTQHMVASFGQLNRLSGENLTTPMLNQAIHYLDQKMAEDYQSLLKGKTDLKDYRLDWTQLHYLYARSFYPQTLSSNHKVAFDFYLGKAKQTWQEHDLFGNSRLAQGMLALVMHRYNDLPTAKAILAALKDSAVLSDEMGMYWNLNDGYYWYEAPIETQSLLIEAFTEISNDSQGVENMKIWLLKQKQTQDWQTTKATASAVYALLLRGDNLLTTEQKVDIKLGQYNITPTAVQAGTGYIKERINDQAIDRTMGEVTITKSGTGVAWGALYWQYFENLDKITSSNSGQKKLPLHLEKQLFKEENSSSGKILRPLSPTENLRVGDRVKVKMVIKADRALEYIHLKDMRASGFEPVNVISQYRYQDGLSYYESTRDTASHFFINQLSAGTYVFEYLMKVNNAGEFSNGITTIESMYAPEFAAHSEGVRVKVEE